MKTPDWERPLTAAARVAGWRLEMVGYVLTAIDSSGRFVAMATPGHPMPILTGTQTYRKGELVKVEI